MTGTIGNEAEHRMFTRWMHCVYQQYADRLQIVMEARALRRALTNARKNLGGSVCRAGKGRCILSIQSGLVAGGSLRRPPGAPPAPSAALGGAPVNGPAPRRPTAPAPEEEGGEPQGARGDAPRRAAEGLALELSKGHATSVGAGVRLLSGQTEQRRQNLAEFAFLLRGQVLAHAGRSLFEAAAGPRGSLHGRCFGVRRRAAGRPPGPAAFNFARAHLGPRNSPGQAG
ncbi:unnamed protein product [Prorocentrum cordatum]|uniref:Uncharacterized protein n=1 Tax=Prorocentrum cordatum TaxID=2364126 RepID=A0ABN9TXP0_9DINO|nr:unnamed protein product [Polarella glacialis]